MRLRIKLVFLACAAAFFILGGPSPAFACDTASRVSCNTNSDCNSDTCAETCGGSQFVKGNSSCQSGRCWCDCACEG